MTLLAQFSPTVQMLMATAVTVLLLAATATYVIPLVKGKLTPRPLSWIGWTMMMGISLFSQIAEKGWQWNLIGLSLSVAGCAAVAALSVKHGIIEPWNWVCLILGGICVVIYLSTKNAWTTTLFAIAADFIVALPTYHNGYKNPAAEKSVAWRLGAAAYLINCIQCVGYDWLYVAFPFYLLLMNTAMAFMTSRETPVLAR